MLEISSHMSTFNSLGLWAVRMRPVIVSFKISGESKLFHHDKCLECDLQDEQLKSMKCENTLSQEFERFFTVEHSKSSC